MPDFEVGQGILYRKGDAGKEVFGPEKVKTVIKKEKIPKTLIVGDNKQVVAVKHAVRFHRRENVTHANAVLMSVTLVCLLSPASSIFIREPQVLWKWSTRQWSMESTTLST